MTVAQDIASISLKLPVASQCVWRFSCPSFYFFRHSAEPDLSGDCSAIMHTFMLSLDAQGANGGERSL